LLAQKIADFAHPLILEAKKEILENLKAALRRARSRDFIGVLVRYCRSAGPFQKMEPGNRDFANP
jgi:hypothetical protein